MKNPNTQEGEFCISCPMRGEIQDEIESMHVRNIGVTLTHLFSSPQDVELGTFGLFTDIDRNPSEPIRVPNIFEEKNPKKALRKVIKHLRDDLALCEGPDTKPGLIRKSRRYIIGCHALRGLSIDDSLTPGVQDAIDTYDLAEELKTNARVDTYTSKKPDIDGELRDFLEE